MHRFHLRWQSNRHWLPSNIGCEDKSTRNLELLPLLEANYHPATTDNLLRLAQVAAETQRLIESLAKDTLEDCLVSCTREQAVIHADRFNLADELVRGQVLIQIWIQQNWSRRDMGKSRWQQIIHVAACQQTTKISLPGNIEASMDPDTRILTLSGQPEK